MAGGSLAYMIAFVLLVGHLPATLSQNAHVPAVNSPTAGTRRAISGVFAGEKLAGVATGDTRKVVLVCVK